MQDLQIKQILSNILPPKNETAYFPTSKEVLNILFDTLDHINEFSTDIKILEPSAGQGAICDFFGQDYMDGVKDSCYELIGIDDYLFGFKLLNFAYQVMVEYFKNDIFEKDDYPKLQKLNLLAEHVIKYS